MLDNTGLQESGFKYPEAQAAVEAEIRAIKEVRRDLDTQIQKLKSFKPSRETSLAITNAQQAVMWLGMKLKAIAEDNPGVLQSPYPTSYDPSNAGVEPTADGLKL